MHKYLRSVGFKKYKRKIELEKVLSHVRDNSQGGATYFVDQADRRFEDHIRISPQTDTDIGIGYVICFGENDFMISDCIPYIVNTQISSSAPCTIQERIEGGSFAGILEDNRVGVSIIFAINNPERLGAGFREDTKDCKINGVCLSALATEGKILLPIKKSSKQKKADLQAKKNRDSMIEAAKKGDENAIEALAIEDVNLVADITRRLCHEDIYSIVDSCFMPYGIECDLYSVIGEIEKIEYSCNVYTDEKIYVFYLDCNDIKFPVAINADDLEGEPQVGRRFKGNIWLQGRIIEEKEAKA